MYYASGELTFGVHLTRLRDAFLDMSSETYVAELCMCVCIYIYIHIHIYI